MAKLCRLCCAVTTEQRAGFPAHRRANYIAYRTQYSELATLKKKLFSRYIECRVRLAGKESEAQAWKGRRGDEECVQFSIDFIEFSIGVSEGRECRKERGARVSYV